MEKRIMKYEALRELLERRDYHALRAMLEGENAVDVAESVAALPPEGAVVVFRTLPKELAAEVFSNLPPETQQIIIQSATDQELSAIVEELYVDDAVDMLEELPANVVKRVLKSARPETRQLINQYLNYPESSVGSIMTAEFTDLRRTMTVAEAIAHIRHTGADSESIYTCYVTDRCRRLEGVVTLRELLLAEDERQVADLMETDVITAGTTEDQEEAVARMMRYDLLSLPVVDGEERLVGIVTVDDVMDVMEEEATEDFEKMAAMAPSEKPYLRTGVFTLARHRILWLLVLMISGMITGGILGRYEAAFAAMPLLVTFIPMLTDTGGNAGSQSSTLVIRGHGRGGDRPGGLRPGAVEGAAGERAGGSGPQRGELCPPAADLPRQCGRRSDGDAGPVRDGGAGQDGGRRTAHGGQALPRRPGHHGRAPYHHHCGRHLPGGLFPDRQRPAADLKQTSPPFGSMSEGRGCFGFAAGPIFPALGCAPRWR